MFRPRINIVASGEGVIRLWQRKERLRTVAASERSLAIIDSDTSCRGVLGPLARREKWDK